MQTTDPDPWQRIFGSGEAIRLEAPPHDLLRHMALAGPCSPQPIAGAGEQGFHSLFADLVGAIEELPLPVLSLVEGCRWAVFLVRGLSCSAITDVVRHHDVMLGMAVVLDVDVLMNRTANQWASWKENQPFAAGDARLLQVTIEEPHGDSRKNAIQFLLLHEFGHVVTAAADFLPGWWLHPSTLREPNEYSFLRLSWTIDAHKDIVPRAVQFLKRQSLTYYGAPGLAGAEIERTFLNLKQSTFATLYGATNAYDDFAESFAVYIHTQIMQRPFRIEALDDPRLLSDAESIAWRCSRKFDLIGQMLGT